jgi:catalase (peroxidase I)
MPDNPGAVEPLSASQTRSILNVGVSHVTQNSFEIVARATAGHTIGKHHLDSEAN